MLRHLIGIRRFVANPKQFLQVSVEHLVAGVDDTEIGKLDEVVHVSVGEIGFVDLGGWSMAEWQLGGGFEGGWGTTDVGSAEREDND